MFFEPVPTLADVLAAPAGHYHFGRDHLVWGAVPGLSGAIQWGAIDDRAVADTRAMLELLGSAGGAVLLDWRGILRVDGEALLAVTPRAQAEGRVTLLVPPGLPGMLLAGAAVAYAPTLAQSHAAAVAALAHPQAAEAVAAAEDRAFELRARTGSEVIERVRAKLRRELAGTTLALCATSVGCSPRTLQRILEAHGTTFSAELRSARVAAATELLAYTDTKIDAIAARTGFASSSRLSATLRRELHVTAGELRARVRRPSRCRPVASRPAIGAPHDHA